MNIIYSHMNNNYTYDQQYLYGLFLTLISLNTTYKLRNLLTYKLINLLTYKQRTKPLWAQSSDYSDYNSINS